jgi:hypothetical protein
MLVEFSDRDCGDLSLPILRFLTFKGNLVHLTMVHKLPLRLEGLVQPYLLFYVPQYLFFFPLIRYLLYVSLLSKC